MYLPAFINTPLIFSRPNPSLTFEMSDCLKGAKTKQTFTADWESLKKRNPAPDWFSAAKFDAEQGPAGATQGENGPGRI